MQTERNFWTSAVGVCHHVDLDVIGEGFFRQTRQDERCHGWLRYYPPAEDAGEMTFYIILVYKLDQIKAFNVYIKSLSSYLVWLKSISSEITGVVEEPIGNALHLSISWRCHVCRHRIGWRVNVGRGSGEGVSFKLAKWQKLENDYIFFLLDLSKIAVWM